MAAAAPAFGRTGAILSLLICLSQVNGELIKYKLNDGNEIPAVALGTSLGHLADGTRVLPTNHSLARAVQWALEAGYRHVDTAALYRVEDEVGLGVRLFLRDNYTRADVYLTTKLWNDAHERNEVIPALKKSLELLQMDYIDLYLVHYPMAYKKDGSISLTDYLETWKGMEDAKEMNLTRSIGVSNFNLTQMQRLWDNARIKPAVLQIEVNPMITQRELIAWCRERGVVVMAYSPFGAVLGRKPAAPPPRADHPTLRAMADKYNKTVPQILIRYLMNPTINQRELIAWCREHGVVVMAYSPFGAVLGRKPAAPPPRADHPTLRAMADKHNKTVPQILIRYLVDQGLVAIPRSTNKERIQQNIDICDFTLSPHEISELSAFNRDYRLRTPAKWYPHPEFPFEKKNLTDAEIQYIIEHSKED